MLSRNPNRLTDSNLAIAVLSFTTFFARLVMLHLGFLPRWVELVYSILLSSMWAMSISRQVSGDFSDPEHISHHPWYLTRSCGASWDENRGYCRVAQASFAVSIVAAIACICRLVVQAGQTIHTRRVSDEERNDNKDWEAGVDGRPGETDHLTPSELDIAAARLYEDALSPVLAFFPESHKVRR